MKYLFIIAGATLFRWLVGPLSGLFHIFSYIIGFMPMYSWVITPLSNQLPEWSSSHWVSRLTARCGNHQPRLVESLNHHPRPSEVGSLDMIPAQNVYLKPPGTEMHWNIEITWNNHAGLEQQKLGIAAIACFDPKYDIWILHCQNQRYRGPETLVISATISFSLGMPYFDLFSHTNGIPAWTERNDWVPVQFAPLKWESAWVTADQR